MEKNRICNFKNHSVTIISHHCYTCKKDLCHNCTLIHGSNPNYFGHNIKEINIDLEKWKIKLAEIEKDNKSINLDEKEKNENDNNKRDAFQQSLNKLNNIFRGLIQDYVYNYNIFEQIKNNLEDKLKNNENINYEEENEKISNIYEEIKSKKIAINFLINSIETLLQKRKNDNLQKRYENLSVSFNNFCFLSTRIRINLQNEINEELPNNTNNKEMLEEGEINDNIISNIKNIDSSVNSNQKGIKIKTIKRDKNIEEKEKINNSGKAERKINKRKKFFISLTNFSNSIGDNNYMSLPKREIIKKKCIMCEDCDHESNTFHHSHHPNKKRKLENVNINSSQEKENHIINNNKVKLVENKNKELSQKINENDSSLNIFNLMMNPQNIACLTLVEIIQKNITISCFKPGDMIHNKIFLHMEKFPFLCSRLININNKAFIIGGRNYWYMTETGNNYVFKLNHVNDKKNEAGKIECTYLKECRYNHQLHCLIYSKLYNAIFVLSGRDQTGCEYGILDKTKEEIKEWKEISHIRNPRENAICLLLNEKYIFLIGGQGPNVTNYEVFDITTLFKKDKPQIWKIYDISDNNKIGKEIFDLKSAGIVQVNNNVFILGGKRKEKYLNYKINFTSDEEDKIKENYKRIQDIVLLENKVLKEYDGNLHFLGQQQFMENSDYFHNINGQGRHMLFHKSIFV